MTPNRINAMTSTPTHIIVKQLNFKHKEKILKAAREYQLINSSHRDKRNILRLTVDLLSETMKAEKNVIMYVNLGKKINC